MILILHYTQEDSTFKYLFKDRSIGFANVNCLVIAWLNCLVIARLGWTFKCFREFLAWTIVSLHAKNIVYTTNSSVESVLNKESLKTIITVYAKKLAGGISHIHRSIDMFTSCCLRGSMAIRESDKDVLFYFILWYHIYRRFEFDWVICQYFSMIL